MDESQNSSSSSSSSPPHALENLPIDLFSSILRIDGSNPRQVMENMIKLRQLNRGIQRNVRRIEDESSDYLFWHNWARECFPKCTKLPRDLQADVNSKNISASNAWYAHLVRSLDLVQNVYVGELYASENCIYQTLSMTSPKTKEELTCAHLRKNEVLYERTHTVTKPLAPGVVYESDEYYNSGADREHYYTTIYVYIYNEQIARGKVTYEGDVTFSNVRIYSEGMDTSWSSKHLFDFVHDYDRTGDDVNVYSSLSINWNELTAEDAYQLAKRCYKNKK